MIENTADKSRKVFRAVAVAGFLLPWIVIIACQIYFGQAAEIRNFPAHLFASGYNFFLVAVMNATPFVILAVAAQMLLRPGQEPRTRRGRVVGLSTAAIGAMALSLFAQVSVWSHTFNPHVHASLAGLGIFLLLGLSLVELPVGYLVGWAVGRSF